MLVWLTLTDDESDLVHLHHRLVWAEVVEHLSYEWRLDIEPVRDVLMGRFAAVPRGRVGSSTQGYWVIGRGMERSFSKRSNVFVGPFDCTAKKFGSCTTITGTHYQRTSKRWKTFSTNIADVSARRLQWLTGMEVSRGLIWQANQAGHIWTRGESGLD